MDIKGISRPLLIKPPLNEATKDQQTSRQQSEEEKKEQPVEERKDESELKDDAKIEGKD